MPDFEDVFAARHYQKYCNIYSILGHSPQKQNKKPQKMTILVP